MIFSLEWLKDYINIVWTADQLARELTLRSLEVEQTAIRGQGISSIVVGKIEQLTPHPNAERLKVLHVDIGAARPLQIVCGGVNLILESKGWNVVVALPGANLHGLEIKKVKLRDVESEGMICSAEELGLPKEIEHGIMRLSPDLKPGADARKLLGFGDVLLNVNVLANRGDCMSHEGLSREIAAISKKKLHWKSSKLPSPKKRAAKHLTINVKNKKICPRYSAIVMSGITIQDSPQWLKNRLQAVGIRPINHIVDLTNYLMMDTGQPLHAFDASKISGGTMTIRASREKETVTTLDGVKRQLPEGVAIIEDDEKLIDLAGIMGGENSAIDDQTTRVVFQAAVFDPTIIRRASRELGHRTEAVARYEKGVDPTQTMRVLGKVVDLLKEIDHTATLEAMIDEVAKIEDRVIISWNPHHVEQLAGTRVKEKEIRSALLALGCAITEKGTEWKVTVPSWRHDLRCGEDLVEEVVRLVGYDQIPETPLPIVAQPPRFDPMKQDLQDIRSIAVAAGYIEVKNFSFNSEATVRKMGLPFEHHVEIANPLSAEHRFLRRELLSSILKSLQANVRQQPSLRLFEIGKVYYPSIVTVPREENHLAIASTYDPRMSSDRQMFDEISGILAQMGDQRGRPLAMKAKPQGDDPILGIGEYLHPRHRSFLYHGNVLLGYISELEPARARTWDADGGIVVAQVNLDRWFGIPSVSKVFQDFSSFPPVKLDIALVVGQDVTVEVLEQIMQQAGGEILRRIELFDVYRGSQLPESKKSLAFHLTYQSFERTLTLQEAQRQHDRILQRLSHDVGAELRQ
jgi:phenylalanyl-tRNA synthetase beta chain